MLHFKRQNRNASPKVRKEVKSNSNVDQDLLTRLGKSAEDVSSLDEFIETDGLKRVLHSWSYFSSVNSHSEFVGTTIKLSRVTDKFLECSQSDALRQNIKEFYLELLKEYTKYIYRALSSIKPSLTNPMLNILTNLVQFDQQLASQFLENFDLNLPVLAKLLVPSKSDLEKYSNKKDVKDAHYSIIRFSFIKFWLALNSSVSGSIRKDLLIQHSKIMNNLWKYMNDIDHITVLLSIFKFLDSRILDQENFKRATKTKILNDNFIFKFLSLYARLSKNDDKLAFNAYTELLKKMMTTSDFGLVFPTPKLWLEGNDDGVSLVINNKSFRVNNKLIYNFLTNLKPSDSNSQLQMVISTLKANPEIIPPYLNWIVLNGGGYHDPSLTSWWIGFTLLYTEILLLPVPNVNRRAKLSTNCLSENIILAPLSKGALAKAVESKYRLIQQFGLQMIMLLLKKLDMILSEFDNINKRELIELVFLCLPEHTALTRILTSCNEDSSKERAKLMKFTAVSILDFYQKLYPISYIALDNFISKEVGAIVNENDRNVLFSVTILEAYLSIQVNQQDEQELKWWNRINGGNSLFVCLLQLASRGDISSRNMKKFLSILFRLTEGTIIFRDSLLVSPMIPLAHLLRSIQTESKIWHLLNETISRAVKSPFKYLDLSHETFDDVSLFVVVLFEQLPFTYNSCDSKGKAELVEWACNLVLHLKLAGEPRDILDKLLLGFISSSAEAGHTFEEISGAKLIKFEEEAPIPRDFTLIEYLVKSSNRFIIREAIDLSNKVITSSYEFSALVVRLDIILNEVPDQYGYKHTVLSKMMNLLGNYVLNMINLDQKLADFLISRRFLSLLIGNDPSKESLGDDRILVILLLNEICLQLPSEIFYEGESNIKSTLKRIIMSEDIIPLKNQAVFAKFFWILSELQFQEYLHKHEFKNEIICSEVCHEILRRKIKISFDDFNSLWMNLTSKDLQLKNAILDEVLKARLVLVREENFSNLLDLVISGKKDIFLLKEYLYDTGFDSATILIEDIQERLGRKALDDPILVCFMGFALTGLPIDVLHDESHRALLNTLVAQMCKFLKSEETCRMILQGYFIYVLKFALCILDKDYVAEEIKGQLIEGIYESIDSDYFSRSLCQEFASFASYVISLDNAVSSHNRFWMQNSMLFITRKIAESSTLSLDFTNFLKKFDEVLLSLLLSSKCLLEIIPLHVIGTQLEAIFSHKQLLPNGELLEHLNIILFLLLIKGAPKGINHQRLMQIFINNDINPLNGFPNLENNRIRFISSLIIYFLYSFDRKSNSNPAFMKKIIEFYLGTSRADDLVIKSILVDIEKNCSYSWMNLIAGWELAEEDQSENSEEPEMEKLTRKEGSRLSLWLSKRIIKNSIANKGSYLLEDEFDSPLSWSFLNRKNMSAFEKYNCAQVFFDRCKSCLPVNYKECLYDPEFLMLLFLNNTELTRYEENAAKQGPTLNLDIEKISESHFLEVIVLNLSHPIKRVETIATILLKNLLVSCENSDRFKDKSLFTVYISNILFTFKNSEDRASPLVWFFYSSLIPIMLNPGHFLYEKAFKYVLSHPSVSSNDLALYYEIMNPKEEDNDEGTYYKELTWLLECLIEGTRTTEDLMLLRSKNALEGILNLLNSFVAPKSLQSLVLRFIYILQTIDGGSDLLITKYAALAQLAEFKNSLKINTSKKTEMIDKALSINVDEIALRWAVSVGGSKRIREWTSDGLPAYTKRLHTS